MLWQIFESFGLLLTSQSSPPIRSSRPMVRTLGGRSMTSRNTIRLLSCIRILGMRQRENLWEFSKNYLWQSMMFFVGSGWSCLSLFVSKGLVGLSFKRISFWQEFDAIMLGSPLCGLHDSWHEALKPLKKTLGPSFGWLPSKKGHVFYWVPLWVPLCSGKHGPPGSLWPA